MKTGKKLSLMRQDRDHLLATLEVSDRQQHQLIHERDIARTEAAKAARERDEADAQVDELREELDSDVEQLGRLIDFAFGQDFEGSWTTSDLVDAVLERALHPDNGATIEALGLAQDTQALLDVAIKQIDVLQEFVGVLVRQQVRENNTDLRVSVDLGEPDLEPLFRDPTHGGRTAVCVD